MSSKQTRKCAVPRCRQPRRPNQIMCTLHWYQVSKATRDEIWNLYRTAPGSGDHMAAIKQAVREVAEKR